MAHSGPDPRPWRQPGNNWYQTPRWRQLKKHVLRRDGVCRRCRAARSTVCDHITPHRGDPVLFYDELNLQGLCDRCHNSGKRRDENAGRPRGCTVDGLPLDPDSPWHNPYG